jgi:protein-S-isoprenylcysteine O-methyltransferase Ste14
MADVAIWACWDVVMVVWIVGGRLARVTLGRLWSAWPNALRADHELHTRGPYSITRHPIYTGLSGMVVGSVLLNGLGSALALTCAATPWR